MTATTEYAEDTGMIRMLPARAASAASALYANGLFGKVASIGLGVREFPLPQLRRNWATFVSFCVPCAFCGNPLQGLTL